MHIAICDDNIADRKQLERLLSRESDRRKATTGVFYVRSFGHVAILGKSPMPYDLFFIDMVNEAPNGYEFALELVNAGVTAPIVLCLSAIDYRALHQQTKAPIANLHFMEKPVKIAELTLLLNHALTLRATLPVSVELRTDQETYYLQEDDITCGFTVGHRVKLILADGRTILVKDHIFNLYSQLLNYSSYLMITKKAFINVNHIDKCSLPKVSLRCGHSFTVASEYRRPLSQYLAQKQTGHSSLPKSAEVKFPPAASDDGFCHLTEPQ